MVVTHAVLKQIKGEISIRIGAKNHMSPHTYPKTQKACVYCETRVTVKCEVCLCRGRGDRVRPASGSAVNDC